MKITKEQLREIILEEIDKELEENLAARAASGFTRKLGMPLVQKAMAIVKNALNQVGQAGSGTRKEEVMAILNQLGISGADLTKIIGTAKGEERAAASSAEQQ